MKKYSYTDMLAFLGVSSAHPGGSALTKRTLAYENINNKHNILDIGCGLGQTSLYLARKFHCNVTAIDNHETMLKKAKKRFERAKLNIPLIKTDIENLPFNSETFHFVISESVLAFTDLEKTVEQIFNVLKPRGKLIAIEMVTEQPLSKFEKAEIKKTYGIKNVLLEDEWKNIFYKNGFTNATSEVDNKSVEQNIVMEEHDPSANIDPQVFQIFEEHAQLLQKYKEKIGYRIFRCVK